MSIGKAERVDNKVCMTKWQRQQSRNSCRKLQLNQLGFLAFFSACCVSTKSPSLQSSGLWTELYRVCAVNEYL